MLRLKEILKEKNLTMAQLADLSGITAANLSNYTNGKVSPTLDSLNKIAKALNIDVTELFRKKENIRLFAEYEGSTYEIKTNELIDIIKNKKL